MSFYKVLSKQEFISSSFAIVPIRYEDRMLIMKWRNEQMYHLRQHKYLNAEQQDKYFNEIVAPLFEDDRPNQLLFSYLKDGECIGYGGLVHINWIDRNAEISFIMNTELEKTEFDLHWRTFLNLIEQVAFNELSLHKLNTYAFDLRPHLYTVLENVGYIKEAVLKENCLFQGKFIDVIVHSKINRIKLRKALISDEDITYKWANSELIRKYSFNKTHISLENHQSWFRGKINNKDCLYLILENSLQTPLGSIRLDINKEVALISYLIDPKYHNRGLGKIILNMCESFVVENYTNIKFLEGFVLEANLASIHIFKSLNYLCTVRDKEMKFIKNLYENR